VYYQDRLAGFIEDSRVDNFWTYGRWRPVPGAEIVTLFAQAVEAGEEPMVRLHESPGRADAYAMRMDDGILEVRAAFPAGGTSPGTSP
jgi:hypothetical protein